MQRTITNDCNKQKPHLGINDVTGGAGDISDDCALAACQRIEEA